MRNAMVEGADFGGVVLHEGRSAAGTSTSTVPTE